MTRTILLTGFGPFGGASTNPAMEIVTALDGSEIDGCKVVTRILPVERFAAIAALREAIETRSPDTIISLGVAVGRAAISIEKVAINFDDFRIPDNAGNQPIGEPIEVGGADAHFATLPINRIRQAISETGTPAEISFSAGTYVCNHTMYGALAMAANMPAKPRAGFIHIPQATENIIDAAKPSLTLLEMTEAIKLALSVCALHTSDIAGNAGDTH